MRFQPRRANLGSQIAMLALAAVACSAALVTTPSSPRVHRSALRMSADVNAAAALSKAQSAALDKIVGSLQLAQRDYPAEVGFDSFSIGGFTGSIRAYDAPGSTNVAWCSGLDLSDGQSTSMSRLTAWCGPLTDVPHLVVSTGVSAGGVDLLIDFRPRADAGYELRNPDGSYPEPDTREAFMKSSVRMEYAKSFFTDDAVAWREQLCNSPGSTANPPEARAEVLALQGPLHLSMRLPLNPGGIDAACQACAAATDRWVQWMQTTPELNRLKVTTTYARDTKIRATLFGFDVEDLTAKFGDQGRSLAAADAGPLDEAYVGGAS